MRLAASTALNPSVDALRAPAISAAVARVTSRVVSVPSGFVCAPSASPWAEAPVAQRRRLAVPRFHERVPASGPPGHGCALSIVCLGQSKRGRTTIRLEWPG